MGAFPTGVTVVTSVLADGSAVGLTVNSFTSVSLDPPLVLVCVGRDSGSHDPLLTAGGFTVNILARDQASLAARFATDPGAERFDGVAWEPGPTGHPVLAGAAAWVACSLEAVHPGGDHSILVGRVEAHGGPEGESLVFYRGGYAAVAR